jgi:hypothetical protein
MLQANTIKAFYGPCGIFTLFLHASRAINTKNLSIDPFTILASKETDNPRNIDWQTDTVQRTPCCGILSSLSAIEDHLIENFSYLVNFSIVQVRTIRNVLSADLVVHISPDSTRRNAVHSNLLVPKVWRLSVRLYEMF